MSSSVATVMPEIGFDDEPISPVSREETVTNRKPSTTIRRRRRGSCAAAGASMIATIEREAADEHDLHREIAVGAQARGRARRVRRGSPSGPRSRLPQIVGSERSRLMMPPAATAPAPM